MHTIGIALGIIGMFIIVGGISGFCGWEILEDDDWFCRLHNDSKIRQVIIIALLATIGIPFVWIYLIFGHILLLFSYVYELARYGYILDED